MNAVVSVQSSSRHGNRREGFYYLWGASLLLFVGSLVVAFFWFSLPKPGYLTFEAPAIPSRGVATVFGQFWLVHTLEGGLTALDPRSPDDGCWFEWVTWDQRFINPCSGSKFQVDGTYIEGPSPRNLDRYHMRVTFADGTLAESNEAGDPILLHGREVARLEVDTFQLIPSPASDLAWRSATCRCQAVPVF